MVISSPRRRALATAEFASLSVDEVSPLIAEWDYGRYEGLTTAQTRELQPDCLVWTHGCPGGESVAQVTDRADRAVALALHHMASRDVLFSSHGHFSRAVITRWLQLPLVERSRFAMLAASIAVCGFEHGVRQLSALGLTCRPQGHEAQRATVCAVRADGTLIAGGVRTCYAEMTVAQAELRSGRAPIVLGAFTFRRGWPCRVDGAAHRTAHRCAA